MIKWHGAIISFYNIMYNKNVYSVSEIPIDTFKILTMYSYCELYRPLVVEKLQKNISAAVIARTTGLTIAEVRGIGRLMRLRR